MSTIFSSQCGFKYKIIVCIFYKVVVPSSHQKLVPFKTEKLMNQKLNVPYKSLQTSVKSDSDESHDDRRSAISGSYEDL